MPSPLVGPSYELLSRPASVQRTINMMPVPLEPGNERTEWVLKDVPGLKSFAVQSSIFFRLGALLHFNSIGTNNIVDEARSGLWSIQSGAPRQSQSAAAARFGPSGLSVISNAAVYITSPPAALLMNATTGYCIEMFVRFPGPNPLASEIRLGIWNGLRSITLRARYVSAGSGSIDLQLGSMTSTGISESFVFAVNTWYHVAASCINSQTRVFVDGVQIGAAPTLIYTNFTSTEMYVDINTGVSGLAHVDAARITTNAQVYSGSFLPPSSPFVDDFV